MKTYVNPSYIYLAGPPEDEEFDRVRQLLTERGWIVRNTKADLSRDLRHQLRLLTDSAAVCMLETWWTGAHSNAIQHVSALMRMPFVSVFTLEPIP